MSDLISRRAAIDAICNACGKIDCDKMDKCEKLQLPPANSSEFPNNSDTISRQAAIDALVNGALVNYQAAGHNNGLVKAIDVIKGLPSAQPERKKMSNKEWIDFLSVQFTVSRTTAREMLHALMKWKAEDNFKKEFSSKKDGEADG